MDLMDPAKLATWLDANLPGPVAPIEVTRMPGGASNIIFKVERAGETYALRRPPAVANDPTSNNMRRELRLLKALGGTDIPHPRLVADCEDTSICGVPFALMDWIEGIMPRPPFPDAFAGADETRALCVEMTEALAKISNADWMAMGLEGFGKPDNFLERQVDRWLGQLERCRSRDLPKLDELCAWLKANTPTTQRTALIHGDYQFVNVMVAPQPPARLLAVVDWESATIGDPLLDLGWMLAGWRGPGEADSHFAGVDWSLFPTRQELADLYAERTGLKVDDLGFYMALAQFKLAIIMEGWFFRYQNGQSTNPKHAQMETGVPHMLSRAAGFAGLG